MTDNEATKLCAEEMGYRLERVVDSDTWRVRDAEGDVIAGIGAGWRHLCRYDPLHDDAQAMALVKRFGLDIRHPYWGDPTVFKHDAHGKLLGQACAADLNRAIVECVANMRATASDTRLGPQDRVETQ